MKKHSNTGKWILTVALLPIMANAATAVKMMLPDDLKVYYSEREGLSRTSFKGAKADVLPTNNEYKDAPGCYIACYSADPKIGKKLGAYPIDMSSYVMVQVRVKGTYREALCTPSGFEN